MSRGRTSRVFTRRIDADGSRRVPDEIIVEEPLAIRLDGELVATTMRTPVSYTHLTLPTKRIV